jgi:hypothetical protein
MIPTEIRTSIISQFLFDKIFSEIYDFDQKYDRKGGEMISNIG